MAQVQVQREPVMPNIGLNEKVLSETAFVLNTASADEVPLLAFLFFFLCTQAPFSLWDHR